MPNIMRNIKGKFQTAREQIGKIIPFSRKKTDTLQVANAPRAMQLPETASRISRQLSNQNVNTNSVQSIPTQNQTVHTQAHTQSAENSQQNKQSIVPSSHNNKEYFMALFVSKFRKFYKEYLKSSENSSSNKSKLNLTITTRFAEINLGKKQNHSQNQTTHPYPIVIKNDLDVVAKDAAEVIFKRFNDAIKKLNPGELEKLIGFFIAAIKKNHVSSELSDDPNLRIHNIVRCITMLKKNDDLFKRGFYKIKLEYENNESCTIEHIICESGARVNNTLWIRPTKNQNIDLQQYWPLQNLSNAEEAKSEGFNNTNIALASRNKTYSWGKIITGSVVSGGALILGLFCLSRNPRPIYDAGINFGTFTYRLRYPI